MIEDVPLTIRYSERALANIREIKKYLLYHFTQKEVENLHGMLRDFENVIIIFPELYPPIINGKKMRRAVLNKKLSVFYTFSKKFILIASVLDNRMNTSRWPI
jgi:plasmid stabilization system protein ParE